MEAVISVIVGELATRSLSFLINRYFKPAPSKEDIIQKLQWMLLRVRLTVEEAEGRSITNQTMLQQLNILRTVMHRGYYLLDTFIKQVPEEEDINNHGLGRFLSLSKFSPSKRVCFSAASKYDAEQLEEMLEKLDITITGMTEFVIFLRNYPPMFRQPYSTHLFMEKCMFGRQLEMERVITFLLHEEPPVHCNFAILPIVGPAKVGKTTLVEHVCCDERVCNHFSHIIFLSDNDFREEKKCKLRDGSRIKHQPGDSNEEKFLVVVELVGNIDDSTWKMLLHSASESSIPKGSKVIITSQSENIINFGTTQALKLKFLSREAYWYYFRTLVFGSTDPEEHQKLASIAMAIIDEYFDQNIHKAFTGPFIYLNNVVNILKGCVRAQAWRQSLECLRDNWKQNGLMSNASLSHSGMVNECIFLRRETKAIEYCVVHNQDHRIVLDNEEAPKINLLEIISGSVPAPPGKFEVLVWKSHLVPYHNHVYSCEILELECTVSRNRQVHKRKIFS